MTSVHEYFTYDGLASFVVSVRDLMFLYKCKFLFRYKERERVMSTFESDLHLPITCIDASEQFLTKLKGVEDPEMKRKIIGREFIAVFDEFALDLEKKLGKKPNFLVQGTLYPDVIESCPPPGSDRTHSHTIKSHHNVGGLPKDMKLKLIEPLKLLFKDEVNFFSDPVIFFLMLLALFKFI
jgi:GMP synthase (glutamine-hydrolysing)